MSYSRCPWCGTLGMDFEDSPAPSDYCGHDPALTFAVGSRVVIGTHKVYCPSWGYLDGPCAGQVGEVVETTERYARVRLDSRVVVSCPIEHLEPAKLP